MNIAVYNNNLKQHLYFTQKIIIGFKNQGIHVDVFNDDNLNMLNNKDYDLVSLWGIYSKRFPNDTHIRLIIEKQQREYGRRLVIEQAYVNRGRHKIAIGYDGLANKGNFYNNNMPDDRWKKLNVDLKDYKTDGNHVLIIGQIPHDTQVQHINFYKWVQNTINEVKKHTDLPIIYRPHPKLKINKKTFKDVIESDVSLEDDFKRAKVCITFNSTTGVDAIINGIPTISMDDGSMVYDITSHDLSTVINPYMVDRKQWSNNIAYTQWNEDEVISGEFWDHLKQGL